MYKNTGRMELSSMKMLFMFTPIQSAISRRIKKKYNRINCAVALVILLDQGGAMIKSFTLGISKEKVLWNQEYYWLIERSFLAVQKFWSALEQLILMMLMK